MAGVDKRLLTDQEWTTTIGRQGGTVYNVSLMHDFGRLSGLGAVGVEALTALERERRETFGAGVVPDATARAATGAAPLGLVHRQLSLLAAVDADAGQVRDGLPIGLVRHMSCMRLMPYMPCMSYV